MIIELIESANISGKAIEVFSEFKGRVKDFLEEEVITEE